MKPPRRRSEAELIDGAIVDGQTVHSLISGSGRIDAEGRWAKLTWVTEFWQEHVPELVDNHTRAVADDEGMAAELRARRRCENKRLDYLLESGLLAGEALRAALQRKAALNRNRENEKRRTL